MKITKKNLLYNVFLVICAVMGASNTYGMNDNNNNDDNNKKNENKRPRENEIKESEHDNVHKKKKQNASEKELLTALCEKNNLSEKDLEDYIRTMENAETTTEEGYNILMLVCYEGCAKLVDFLVNQKKVDIYAETTEGYTAFFVAITHNNSIEILQILLNQDKRLLIQPLRRTGITPLMLAVCLNKSTFVQYILENLGQELHNNINTFNEKKETALCMVIKKYVFLKKQAEKKDEIVLQNYLTIIKMLIDHGADTNIHCPLSANIISSSGEMNKAIVSPLLLACYNNDEFLLKLLLKNEKTDINAFEPDQHCTSLMHASVKNYSNIVKILLSLPSININQTDKKGSHALLYALRSKVEIIEQLIKHGACVNFQANDGLNFLMKFLGYLKEETQTNQENRQETAKKLQQIITLILDAGVDFSTKIIINGVSCTAIDIARSMQLQPIENLLLQISHEQGDFTQGKISKLRQPARFYLQNFYNAYKNNLKYEENSDEYKQHSNYIKMLYYLNRLIYSKNYNINEILSTCKFRTNDDKKTYYNLPLTKEELKMGSQLVTFSQQSDYVDLSFNYLCLADRRYF